jgi:hypothetical protein
MEILDLNVIDSRETGAYIDPFISIRLDEEVEETDDPRYQFDPHSDRWRIIPCGPFFAIEYKNGTRWSETADLGRFNTLGFHREQLIEVRLAWEGGGDTLTMGVPRARRLLRKYENSWHIIVNETAAMRGKVAWRVERRRIRCFGIERGLSCTVAPIETVWYGGAHVNLCSRHLQIHHARAKDERIERVTS